jgi:hypothetical protein
MIDAHKFIHFLRYTYDLFDNFLAGVEPIEGQTGLLQPGWTLIGTATL